MGMVVAKIAMIFLLIQVAGGLVSYVGVFGNTYYDNTLVPPDDGSEVSAGSEAEQDQIATQIYKIRIRDMVTWGWTKGIFSRLGMYNDNDSATRSDAVIEFTDAWNSIVALLNTMSIFFIAIGFFQLKKQQPDPV